MATREERLQTFLDRLQAAVPAKSRDEAFSQISTILTEVEDELSGIPNDPGRHLDDNRLYPPQLDSQRSVDGRPDIKRYRSKGHNTYIRDNGAIRIGRIKKTSIVIFDKAGADGKFVE